MELRTKTVLAKLAVVRTSLLFGFITACCLFLYWGVATEGPVGILENHPGIAPFLIFGLMGSVYALRLSFFFFYQVIIRNADAVWVEGDYIIYINERLLKVAIEDVQTIDILPMRPRSSFNLIFLHLKNGTQRRIGGILTQGSLSELRDKLAECVGIQ